VAYDREEVRTRLLKVWPLFLFLSGVAIGILIRPKVAALLRPYSYAYAGTALTVSPDPPKHMLEAFPAAPSPVSRFEPAITVFDGRIYVFGGFDSPQLTITARCDAYDPAADTWSRLTDMPLPVTHAGIAEADGIIWIVAGFAGRHPGAASNDVWRYDTRSDRWMPGPSLPEARGGGALVRLERSLHYFGGVLRNRTTDSGAHWVLDLDDPTRWKQAAPLPDARTHLAGIAFQGKVHAIGGQHGHDADPVDVASHHAFDPKTGQWQALRPLPTPRSHAEAGTFVHNGRIVVSGGRSLVVVGRGRKEIAALHDVDSYDPSTNEWSSMPGLPVAMRASLARVIGDRVYAGLGGLLPNGSMPSSTLFWFRTTELSPRAAAGR
jgi:N-acetylneuraminic acid mutarotase